MFAYLISHAFEIVACKLTNFLDCFYIVDVFIFCSQEVRKRVSDSPPHGQLRSPQVSSSYSRDIGSTFLTKLFTSRIRITNILRITIVLRMMIPSLQMHLFSGHHSVSLILESI